MKSVIFGTGLIVAGCIGIAIGNLEETIYYTSEIGNAAQSFKQGAAYYMFWAYLLIGLASVITGMRKKDQQ